MAVLIFLSHIFLPGGRNDDHSQRRLCLPHRTYTQVCPYVEIGKRASRKLTLINRQDGGSRVEDQRSRIEGRMTPLSAILDLRSSILDPRPSILDFHLSSSRQD